MNLSNFISQVLLEMLEGDGTAEIQRNELAEKLGCVPSQINYVLSSRFTPEQGYVVESRRGGKGYIKISRINFSRSEMIMHVINSIGAYIDAAACRANILNLCHMDFISPESAALMLAASNENAYRSLPSGQRDAVRAAIFKQMLLAVAEL